MDLTKTSFFRALFTKIAGGYRNFKSRLKTACRDNRSYLLTVSFRRKTEISFGYCFFWVRPYKEIRQNVSAALQSTKLLYFREWYEKSRYKFCYYSRTSTVMDSINEIKKEIDVIKIASIFLLTAILTNILFSLLLNKEMGGFAWFSRVIFLLTAMVGLTCGSGWQKLEETSFIAKQINKYYKREG